VRCPLSRAADPELEALAVNEAGASPRYPPPEQLAQQQQQQAPAQQIPAGVPQAQYRQQPQQQQQQQPFPQRTTSHRHSSGIALDQQTLQQLQGGPQPAQGYDQQPRRGSYQPQSSYTPEPKKQGLRSRLGLTSHKEEDRSKSNKVGRRVSVRKSDPRDVEFRQQEEHRLRAAQWNQQHRAHGSSSHLAPSDEHDEDHLDPFLQQEDEQPRVPPKDSQFQQHPQPHPQQYSPNAHQEQYNRPPLARVSTEGSYHAQGGVEHYSPEHQGLQPQQHPPSYQNYQQVSAQRPSNPNDYQAYPPPQNAPSPLVGGAPVHPQQQQSYYQYQAQQAAQLAQQPKSPQSPPEPQVQNPRFSQQSQPSPQQPQPHQGQDFPQLQHGRSTSQAQGEPNAPTPPQAVPQIVQGGGQPIDGQHSQQLRPPSSHASLAPPSPLQSQPPAFQAYDQQGQPSPSTEPHSQSATPPQQDSMPPANSGPRNTLRKVNDGGQQQAPPSRESSLLQQSSTQGQAQGQQPVSPGIQTFGANVVPTASQGQPYRGDKGQTAQGGEIGRATPPPRTTADMSDEEIAQLMKDHDVLRKSPTVMNSRIVLTRPRRKVPKSEAILLRAANASAPTSKHPRQPASLSFAHILGR
jgi:hypothetical protein